LTHKIRRTARHPAARSGRHVKKSPGRGEPRVAEGIVSPHRSGFGFARVAGLEPSVFLPPREMAGLVQGDRVSLELHKDAQDRWVGTVTGIIERGVGAFLGVLERQGKELWIRAADRRLGLLCRLVGGEVGGCKAGDWVIADIHRYPKDSEPGEARIRTLLDPERPLQLATEAAIARQSLPVDFPEAVENEAKACGEQVDPAESAQRVDLRMLPLVTIDGEDARDFDDAVYAEPAEDGWRVLVAIADVSHYVRPGTALDREAQARGTSVYFPSRVLPMLPEALSNHLCSLAPHVDRLCMVADMLVSARGALKGWRVYPAVMRSAARLTYNQAHAILFEGNAAERARLGTVAPRLEPLVSVYRALLKARAQRGALEFDAPEAQFRLDAEGQVHGIEHRSRNDAHKLIEECMVLANVAVARELHRQRQPALYRVHGRPEARKLKVLVDTLRVLGIDPQLPEEPRTRDLAHIAPRVKDEQLRPFVESLVVRSLQQAVYQPANIGHFGLALADYAHFTSPIRRYPDLLVHRALRVGLGLAPHASAPEGHELESLGEELTRLEKRADEADRFVDNFLKCAWLRDRVGQVFEGLVTTVVEFGCFVQLLEPRIDGLLHLASLAGDDFTMTRDGAQWQGKRTGRRLGPGQRLKVRVTAVNPVEGLVDLELAD
jgi:ribonuclease R